MGTVQAAVAEGALDAVRAGDFPRETANDRGIIESIWLGPSVTDEDDLDHQTLFEVHREATAKVIRKAMRREPTIDWLMENQDKVTHDFRDLGIKGELYAEAGERLAWRPSSRGSIQRLTRTTC